MSIRPLRPDQQEVVIATLETATDLSSELGPDAALAKAAKDHGLPYNLLQYAVNAYNTGRSVSNIKSGSTREEKAADVPLASLDGVIAHVYPDKAVKKASVSSDYHMRPADLFSERPVRKVARREALPSAPSDIPDDRMVNAITDIRQGLETAKSSVNQEFFLYKRAQKNIQDYLDNQRAMKLSDLLEQSESAFGDMARVVLEPLSDAYETHKSASRNQVIRVDRGPFLMVKAAISQLEKLYEMGVACGQAEERMRAAIKTAKEGSPALRGYIEAVERSLNGPTPKKAAVYEPEPANKKAFDIGKSLLSDFAAAPADFGKTVARTAPAAPKPAAPAQPATPAPATAEKPKTPNSLFDPSQHEEVGSLQKSVAINNLLASDPDLAGYDRNQIIRAYNEIQTSFPRVASSTAALRPFLQRHLTAGGLDEFALKNLADQEASLGNSQRPQGAQ